MVAPKSQLRTEPASIQIRFVQPGRSYASITTQEKMASSSLGQFMVDAIQTYVMKKYREKMGNV